MNFERLIFVSGQGGTDPATGKIAGDVESQTEQCLKNVQAILQGRRIRSAARAAVRRVPHRHEGIPAHEWRLLPHVRTSIVRRGPRSRPQALPGDGLRVEIDCIAYVPC